MNSAVHDMTFFFSAFCFLFFYLFNPALMLFRLLIIVDPDKENISCIFQNRIRIFFVLDLLYCCICAFIPLKFYHQCRISSSVFRFGKINFDVVLITLLVYSRSGVLST